jgi:hypothetical protein
VEVFEFELHFFDEVELDVLQAKTWYYEQSPDTDLEERFSVSIVNTISILNKNPFIFYPKFENVRVAHAKGFPYGVHFITNELLKTITIVAVLHNKVDISKLKNRLG